MVLTFTSTLAISMTYFPASYSCCTDNFLSRVGREGYLRRGQKGSKAKNLRIPVHETSEDSIHPLPRVARWSTGHPVKQRIIFSVSLIQNLGPTYTKNYLLIWFFWNSDLTGLPNLCFCLFVLFCIFATFGNLIFTTSPRQPLAIHFVDFDCSKTPYLPPHWNRVRSSVF